MVKRRTILPIAGARVSQVAGQSVVLADSEPSRAPEADPPGQQRRSADRQRDQREPGVGERGMWGSEDLTGEPQRRGHDDGREGGHDDEGGEQQQTPASDPAPVASVIPTPADRLGVVRQQQAQPGSDGEDAEGQDGEHDTNGDDLDHRLALKSHHQRDDRGGNPDQGSQYDAARQQPVSESCRVFQHGQGLGGVQPGDVRRRSVAQHPRRHDDRECQWPMQ